MNIFTIGFTQQSAEQFFEGLRKAGVKRVLDVRINNSSQLAGFAKQADLRYFLKQLCHADYVPLLALAPTKPLLAAYRNGDMTWPAYEQAYRELLAKRRAEREVDAGLLEGGCLLCSELEPHFCHRRLAVEFLHEVGGFDLNVQHLVKGKVLRT